ncbi:MAG: hypothetical protein ABF586_02685 [Sporolactobacillus sp.]
MVRKRSSKEVQNELDRLYQREVALEQELLQVRQAIDSLEQNEDDFDARHQADMKRLSEIERSLQQMLKGWSSP